MKTQVFHRWLVAALIALLGACSNGRGTLNDAAQGYLNEDGSVASGPELGLIPSGTGGDFRRTFELSGDLEAAAARLLGISRPTLAKKMPRPSGMERAS